MELSVDNPGDERELAALADRARSSSAAFEELARRVRARVRRWAHRVMGDADDADDVAQIVLLRLQQHVGQFEGRSRFTSWLYGLTRNVAIDRKRTEQRRSTLLALDVARGGMVELVARSAVMTDADTATLVGLVQAYWLELPPRQREIFKLGDLDGHSPAEIAKRLGIEAVTVRVNLLKARRAIRLRMLARHPRLLQEYEQEYQR